MKKTELTGRYLNKKIKDKRHKNFSLTNQGGSMACEPVIPKTTLCLILGLFILFSSTTNADYYIRSDASGNNDGSSWTDAYNDLPFGSTGSAGRRYSNLQRNHTYYVSDGYYNRNATYPNYIFNDAENDTQYITIKKATINDHGTSTGWDDSYGDGQAFFNSTNGTINFLKGYYVFDGQNGNGSNKSSYGFRMMPAEGSCDAFETSESVAKKHYPVGMPATGYSSYNISHITFTHVAISVCGDANPNATQIAFYSFPNKGRNLVFSNNFLEGSASNMLILNWNDSVITNNYFANQWSSSANHGQQISPANSDNITFSNNIFTNSTSFIIGAHNQGGGGNSRWKVYNNIVFGDNSDFTAVFAMAESAELDGLVNSEFHHNTFINVDCGARGAVFVGQLSDPSNQKSYAYNNLIYNSTLCEMNNAEYSSNNGIIHDYNAYYDSNDYNDTNGINTTGNPFVNSSAGDYHLKSDSLAIDAGINLSSEFATDFDGITRPQGSGWDIGAYEYDPCSDGANFTILNATHIQACSCDYARVNASVGNVTYRNTVIVPAGNCLWNRTLTITKGITFQGAGIDLTNITGNISNAVILYSPDSTSRTNKIPVRITGFTIDAGWNGSNIKLTGQLSDQNLIKNNRIDHNRLKNGNSACVYAGWDGRFWGLIDNNQFEDCYTLVRVYGNYWYDWDMNPLNIGSSDGFIIENNTATWSGAKTWGNILSSGHGMRYTFRFNRIYNITNLSSFIEGIDVHGNTGATVNYSNTSNCANGVYNSSCVQNRGVISAEIYRNNISVSTGGCSGTFRWLGAHGGTLRVFDNDIMQNDCSLSMTLDEPDGPDGDDLLNTWPGYDPVKDSYIFNNKNSTNEEINIAHTYAHDPTFLQLNRDYWTYNSSFDGASGIGLGIISSLPATCTIGTGYWANDSGNWNNHGSDGTLYRCTSTNKWTQYYAPFDYPHPLVSGIPGVSLLSPQWNYSTNSTNITFNCSAIDSGNLANITLYSNFSGSWTANETKNINGTYNESIFTKTLSAGSYAWNCKACDVEGNCDFGNINYTLTISGGVAVNTYWVDDDGVASWADCKSETNLSGASACNLTTANTNVVAGDTVYLRGGVYTLSSGGSGINPGNNGVLFGNVCTSKITFSAYNSENVTIAGDGVSDQWGIRFSDKQCFIIDGIKFRNLHRSAEIVSGSSHNEIKNCEFYHTGANMSFTQYEGLVIKGVSTNNWIHHNVFHTMGYEACGEGWDLLRIGGTDSISGDNYNTVENNIFYAAGHALTEDYGMYNVWKNNVGHNEGWKASSNIVGNATWGNSTSLIDNTKDFVALGVQVGWNISSGVEYFKGGTIIAVTTNTLTYVARDAYGPPTFSNGQLYAISQCLQANDPSGTNPGNGMYGHRNFAATGYEAGVYYRYNLFEANRAGYAASNPVNGGAEGYMLGSPGNIVRYNSFYGSDGVGINLKSFNNGSYTGKELSGANNRIYSNTIYKNGQAVFGYAGSPMWRYGLLQYSKQYSTDNVLKNNLFYKNGPAPYYDFKDLNFSTNTLENNWCVDNVSGCTIRSGDPQFVNPDLSDMTSTSLPDLNLASGSIAIDNGIYLTNATLAGINSVNLTVLDALYFQDGSWGSNLARNQTFFADWIAVGSPDNIAAISSIDYNSNEITLKTPLTWTANDPVWLYKDSSGRRVLYGDAPDMGAYESNYTAVISNCSEADVNGDGVVSDSELQTYSNRWVVSLVDVSLQELMVAMREWKNGC